MNPPRLETVRTVIRETAIDAMPELAVQLEVDHTVVQQHLIRELGVRIHTVESSEWLNKHRDTWNLSPKSRTDAAIDYDLFK